MFTYTLFDSDCALKKRIDGTFYSNLPNERFIRYLEFIEKVLECPQKTARERTLPKVKSLVRPLMTMRQTNHL